jgi:hypothetical protein
VVSDCLAGHRVGETPVGLFCRLPRLSVQKTRHCTTCCTSHFIRTNDHNIHIVRANNLSFSTCWVAPKARVGAFQSYTSHVKSKPEVSRTSHSPERSQQHHLSSSSPSSWWPSSSIRVDDGYGATRVLAHRDEPIDRYSWPFSAKFKSVQSWQNCSNHVPAD